MTRPARIAAAARRDLRSALAWITRDNPAAALRLREAVIRAADRIGEHPGIGVPRPDMLPPSRRLLALPGWPYVIVTADDIDPPIILRILHGAHDLPPLLRDAAEP
ncbi:type II toxin-antitoxin system RelE/ParE family toxin [Paeniroseomonas aquatica]|uniref:Type II toxin-antitoxin system RelE/ParE family toxin n=1 Tax=Paeniroseomonas aquatica TaxID=373043 RepID=A0ABT8AAW5_9PROT|nr:type II toxin-antitoxin system RelE/ParE family toxin [Paeniroseomonas aquatica]MDN3566808.1 type II toxin-antitoxin system RelE/ParE family toxin [Paeniroseomonas aquatica]